MRRLGAGVGGGGNRRGFGKAVVVGVVSALATLPIVAVAHPAAAASSTTFDRPGQEHTYEVPSGVKSVCITAHGAQGGNVAGGGFGGKGAFVQATVLVTPGETLFLNVGGRGGRGDYPRDRHGAGGGQGGYNGGGKGGAGSIGPPSLSGPQEIPGGGGGGGGSGVYRKAAPGKFVRLRAN
jgi:hypothetical protein